MRFSEIAGVASRSWESTALSQHFRRVFVRYATKVGGRKKSGRRL